MMEIKKIVFALAFISFLAIGCKNNAKKETSAKEQKTEVIANAQELSLSISGMTCEIGCANKIASDLNKKEGVLEAKVVFNDSVANIKYDANKINKAELIAFVEGIGSGDMYKASELSKKSCKKECAKACCSKTDAEKKSCDTSCKKKCCTKGDKKACSNDCKKDCCTKAIKA